MAVKSIFKEYYSSFYGNQCFRECFYVDTDLEKSKPLKFPDVSKLSKVPKPDKLFYSFILSNRNKGTGTLISSLTFYQTLEDYHSKDYSSRFTDRLFFDFDIDSLEAKALKENIKNAKLHLYEEERRIAIKDYQKQFRNLILNDNLLIEPFKELKTLIDYFKGIGIKTYPLFSGSKGFHLVIFLKPMKLVNINQISYNLAVHLKDKLKLKKLDLSVNKDSISRKQRIPFSKHERTLLYTVPIADSISYDDLLQQIKRNRPKPIPIDKESYLPDETFHKNIINLNAKITEEMMKSEMKQQELQKRKRELLSAKRKNLNKDSVDLDFSNIDMRSLVSKILGSPEKEYSNYSMFKCPFHADNNPSLKVNEKWASCYSCGFYYNYYDFVKEYYNLKTVEEITSKIYEIY